MENGKNGNLTFDDVWKKTMKLDADGLLDTENIDLISKIVAEEKGKLIRKLLNKDLKNGICKFKELQNLYNQTTTKIQYFITISSLEIDFKIIEQSLKKKYIINWTYSLEQGGDTIETMGKHPHIHMLITTNQKIKLSRLISEFGKTFKLEKNFIDVKTVFDGEGIEDYLNGNKEDKKQMKCKFDMLWRQKNNYLDRYNK